MLEIFRTLTQFPGWSLAQCSILENKIAMSEMKKSNTYSRNGKLIDLE